MRHLALSRLLGFQNCFKHIRLLNTQQKVDSEEAKQTHFGFEKVKETEKAGKG